MDDRFDVEIELHGPTGSGKTVMLAALHRGFGGDITSTSAGFFDQHALLLRKQVPERTKQVVGQGEKHEQGEQAKEWFEAKIGGHKVRITSQPGDLLRGELHGGVDAARFSSRFLDGAPRIPVFVLNPYVADEEIAWKGFFSFIATLQRTQGLPLAEASSHAARLLFHIEDRDLATLNTSLEQCIGDAKRNIVLTFDPARSTDRGAFHVEYELGPDMQRVPGGIERNLDTERRLLDSLEETARKVAKLVRPERDMLRKAVGLAPNAIVALTHDDLQRWTPAVTARDIERLFDDMFAENTGRLPTQQVICGNLTPSPYAHDQNDWGATLLLADEAPVKVCVAIRAMIERAAFVPSATPRSHWAPLAKESLYHSLRAVPCLVGSTVASHALALGGLATPAMQGATAASIALLLYGNQGVMLAVLLIALFLSPFAQNSAGAASGDPVEELAAGRFLGDIGATTLGFAVLVAAYVALRSRAFHPRWSLSGRGPASTVTLRAGAEQAVTVPATALQLERSPLARLLGCAWASPGPGSVTEYFVPDAPRLQRALGDAGAAFRKRRRELVWLVVAIVVLVVHALLIRAGVYASDTPPPTAP